MAKAAATKTVTVTAKQIAQALAEKHELQKKATVALFDDFFAAITKSLKKGERVRMGDIGILQVRKRAARQGLTYELTRRCDFSSIHACFYAHAV